jgi:hypothetical protein
MEQRFTCRCCLTWNPETAPFPNPPYVTFLLAGNLAHSDRSSLPSGLEFEKSSSGPAVASSMGAAGVMRKASFDWSTTLQPDGSGATYLGRTFPVEQKVN